ASFYSCPQRWAKGPPSGPCGAGPLRATVRTCPKIVGRAVTCSYPGEQFHDTRIADML
ncbi:hypothetical protein A2U01_0077616, partial [Trifolium medium]|nr:hypothetical protein [Trifolium medium]